MANRQETYTLRLAVEGGKVVKAELGQIGTEGEKSFQRLERASKGATHTMGDLGTFLSTRLLPAFSAVRAATSVVSNIQSYERLEQRLKRLSNGSKDYADIQEYLKTKASELNINIVTLSESYAKLLALQDSGIVNRGEVEELTEGFANLKAALGVDDSQIENVLYGLSQALSQGTVQAQELNQVIEPLPGLLNKLADAAGVQTPQAFREMVKAGDVTSAALKGYILEALKEYDGAARDMAGTSVAAFADLQNAWYNLSVEVGKSGLITGMTLATDAVTRLVEEIGVAIGVTYDLITAFGDFLGLVENTNTSGMQAFVQKQIELTNYFGNALGAEKNVQGVRFKGGSDLLFGTGRESDLQLRNQMLVVSELAKQTTGEVAGFKKPPPVPGEKPDEIYEQATKARLKAQKEAEKQAEASAKKIRDVVAALQFEKEQLQRNEKEQLLYNQLRSAGVSLDSAAGQQIAALVDDYYALEQAQKQLAEFQKSVQDEAVDAIERHKQSFEGLNDIIEKGLRGQINSWRDLGSAVLEELQNILIKQLEVNSIGGKSGSGGIIGSLIGAAGSLVGLGGPSLKPGALDLAKGGSIFKFATGGSFTVGGDGGTDTTPVQFMATRGEKVTVETPHQQARRGGGDTYYIDARGADSAAIARLEAKITALNGSIERRVLSTVQNETKRNPRFIG